MPHAPARPKSFIRLLAVLVAALTVLCAPAPAHAANTTLSVSKTATPGFTFAVVDSHGEINCGVGCSSDSGSYPEVDCLGPPTNQCFPDTTTLTVSSTPAGSTLYWSGTAADGCVNGNLTCDVPAQGTVVLNLVDTQAPTVTMNAPAAAKVGANGLMISASSYGDNHGVTSVQLLVNGFTYASDTSAPYNFNWVPSVPQHGTSPTLQLRAVDVSGNSGNSATTTRLVDREVLVSFTGSPPTLTASRALSLDYSPPADAVGGSTTCRLRTDGVFAAPMANADCLPTLDVALAGTEHRIELTVFDDVGNSSTITHDVTVDDADPVIDITSPADSVKTSPSGAATFTVSDAHPGMTTCAIDGAALGACTSAGTHAFADLAEGTHTLTVASTDALGNQASSTRTFRVNEVPPVASITSGPDDSGTVVGTGFTFGIAGDATATSFQCRVWIASLAAPDWGACNLPGMHAAAGLPLGTYAFEVRAVDVDGLTSTPVRRTVTLVAQTTTPTDPAPTDPTPTAPTPTNPTPANPSPTTLQRMSRVVPAVRGRIVRGRYQVSLVQVARLPAGAAVRFTCTGRGCPRGARVTVRNNLGIVTQLSRRLLSRGAVVKVFITRTGFRPMTVTVKVGRTGAAVVTIAR